MIKILDNQKGQMFILALIVLGLVLINTLVIIGSALTFTSSSKYSLTSLQATNLAEAGIDKAVAAFNASGSYGGEDDTPFGPGTFSVNVSDLGANKLVEATGFVPNKTNPKAKRTIKIQLSKGDGVAFNYGVQVGEGGLDMGNNSIINGSVYSNGNVNMKNGASIDGDVFVAGGVQPTPEVESSCSGINCTEFTFGKNSNGELDTAQSFISPAGGLLRKVSLSLRKSGTPTDKTVRILADKNGEPDKNNVLASGTLFSKLVGSSVVGFIDVVFSSPASLTAGTTYWLMVDTSADSSNYFYWQGDTLQTYANGKAMWSPDWNTGNPDWNNITPVMDFVFRTYMGGVPTYVQGPPGSSPTVDVKENAHANTLNYLNVTKDAYFQAEDHLTVSGIKYPNSPDPAPAVMPISEPVIQEWRDQATQNGTVSGNITNCPATLEAKRYDGDITLPTNCTVTIKHPTWITGNLTLSSGDTLKLDSGSSSGVVMVENFVSLGSNNIIQGSGTAGSYLILLSNFNTKDDPQGRVAIDVTNNGNSGILYSNLGSISISNNNSLTEVTGWKLILSNNVTITYDQGLAGAFFSSGPGGEYSVIKGTYQSN